MKQAIQRTVRQTGSTALKASPVFLAAVLLTTLLLAAGKLVFDGEVGTAADVAESVAVIFVFGLPAYFVAIAVFHAGHDTLSAEQ